MKRIHPLSLLGIAAITAAFFFFRAAPGLPQTYLHIVFLMFMALLSIRMANAGARVAWPFAMIVLGAYGGSLIDRILGLSIEGQWLSAFAATCYILMLAFAGRLASLAEAELKLRQADQRPAGPHQ